MNELTREQERVINANTGKNIRVIACAGSGKTTVMTRRIARLLNEKIATPEKIKVITFTRKAAKHMENKLLEFLDKPDQLRDLFVGTIHSFCFSLLQDFYPNIREYYEVIDEDKQFLLFYLKYNEWGIDKFKSNMNKYEKIRKIITSIEILQKENIKREYPIDNNLLSIVEKYENYLSENSYFDYGQLISVTVDRLSNDNKFLEWAKNTIDYLFVDEYQDVDNLQDKLIQILSKNDTFVVGDDDQSIYQFRGTDVNIIRNFDKNYNNVLSFNISDNWRCSQNILSLGKNIIEKNSDRLKKDMKPTAKGGVVEYKFFNTVSEEVDFIIGKIKYLLKNYVDYRSNIAILLRSVKSSGYEYIEGLKNAGLAPLVIGDSSLFQIKEISEIKACLELLLRDGLDHNSKPYLLKLFPENLVDELMTYNNLYQVPLGDLQEKHPRQLVDRFENLMHLKDLFERRDYQNITDLVYRTIDALNLLITSSDAVLKNVASFTKISRDYDDIHGGKNLRKFLGYLTLYAERNFDEEVYEEEEVDAVKIMTIHQAKGLQFDAVFLPMMVKGRFPIERQEKRWFIPDSIFNSNRYMSNIEDERRLLYVAITRARSFLYVTGASRHPALRVEKKPSIFFYEVSKFVENEKNQHSLDIRSPLSLPEVQQRVFSFSEIEYYITCPYRYKLIYKLGFRTMANPYFEFGRSIHHILSIIHSLYKDGSELTEDDVKEIYEKNFRINTNLPQFKIRRRKKHGLKYVLNYFRNYKHILKNVNLVEEDIMFESNDILIKGRIDLLVKNGESDYTIIDFKTGSYRDYLGQTTQLQFYAMAVKKRLNSKKISPKLHFIEEDKILDVPANENDIEMARNRILDAVYGIKNKEFVATPGEQCSFCEFNMVCPYKEVK